MTTLNNWENLGPIQRGETIQKSNKGFYFLFFCIACFIIMSVFAIANYYFKRNYISSENIIFTSDMVDNYGAGSVNKISFLLENKNRVDIRDVRINFEYEKGRKSSGEYNIEKQVFLFGDILSGSNVSTTTEVLFLGKEGDVRKVSYVITYKIKNGSVFEKVISNSVNISSSLVSLDIDSSASTEGVIAGDRVDLFFKIKNTTKDSFDNGVIDIDLPFGFITDAFLIKDVKSKSFKDIDNNKTSNSFNSNVSTSTVISNVKIITKNIKVPKLDSLETIEYKLSGYFDSRKYGENVFRFSLSNKDINNKLSLISSDIYSINTIAPILTYEFRNEQNSVEVRNIKANQKYNSFIILKNTSDYAYDNLFLELTTDISSAPIVYDYSKNSELSRINPGDTVELPFEFIAKSENKFKIQIYGNKKGDNNKKLLTNEYYDFKAN